jgi:hypothetical protein
MSQHSEKVNRPGLPETLLCESGSHCLTVFLLEAGCFELDRRDVADRL